MKGLGYARPTLMQQIASRCRSNYPIFRASGNLRMLGIAVGIALSQAVAAADNVYVNNGVSPFDPAFLRAARNVVDHYNVDPLSPVVSPLPRRLDFRTQRDLTSPGIEGNNGNRARRVTRERQQSPQHQISPELVSRLDGMGRQIQALIEEGAAALVMPAPEMMEPNSPLPLYVRPVQLPHAEERASMLEEIHELVDKAISQWEAANENSAAISQRFAAETHMKNVYAHLLKREKAKASIAAARPAPDEDGNVGVNTPSPAGLLEAGHSDSDRPVPIGSRPSGESSHYALHPEWLHSLVAEIISTTPLRLPPGISIDDARVSVGAPGSERNIVNVARGTHSTDAVNKGQLDEAVARVDGDASAGIASAMAVAGLPQPTSAGRSIATASSASYRGRPGMAFGVSHVTSDNRWVMKLAASANGRGYFGAVAAGGFQW